MGRTTLVPFRSVPTAELNLKLRKHSGDAAGSLSSSTLCFVRNTRTEAEVETNFFALLEVLPWCCDFSSFFFSISSTCTSGSRGVVIVHQLPLLELFPCWEVLVVAIETPGTDCGV